MLRIALLLLLVLAPVAVRAEWREAGSKHFVIYSEQSEKQLRDFAIGLERYDKGLRLLYSLPDEEISPSNRLTIFVLPSLSAVRRAYGDSSSSVGGFYQGRASGSIAVVPKATDATSMFDLDAGIVLQHEYAHHFLFWNFPGAYPAWFSEGFAEFGATAKREPDGSVRFGLPANHRAVSFEFGPSLPIEKLLGPPEKRDAGEVEALYSRGWLLTHYLTFNRPRSGQLGDYLKRFNSGAPSLEAARAAFGDLAKLEKELNQYLRSKMTFLQIQPSALPIGEVHIRQLSSGTAAMMSVRVRSKVGVDAETAKKVVKEARPIATRFPADAGAQIALAEAELDAGNLVEAEAAAERALATDPKAVEALILRGRAKMAIASALDNAPAATWKEIRRIFIAANHLEPDHPQPLILFYQSFASEGIEPSASARSGLVQAQALAPQDMEVRWLTAHRLLLDDKATEARRVLGPAAYNPHGGEASELARGIITAIDQGGAKAGLSQWERSSSKSKSEAPSGRASKVDGPVG